MAWLIATSRQHVAHREDSLPAGLAANQARSNDAPVEVSAPSSALFWGQPPRSGAAFAPDIALAGRCSWRLRRPWSCSASGADSCGTADAIAVVGWRTCAAGLTLRAPSTNACRR